MALYYMEEKSMPLVKIETRKPWSSTQKKEIIEAVHSALREALKIPADDRNIRFHTYAPEDFEVPTGRSENYILVEVTLFIGRTFPAKKALYQGIVANLGQLGIAASDVFIILHEVPLENWGIRGGIPASEVDLGFKVGV
jgi:phenylpyruvate tautomerase PptA (4-oxalocrotonate tautomerase family)